MKAYISHITPHHAGFGQFQRGESCAVDGDWDSVEEYAQHVARENHLILSYAIDPDIAQMGDEDGEKLAAKLREVSGAVLGGHDTLVAYWLGTDSTGEDQILVESVELVNE